MIIDCISDLHSHFPKLEGGDLLIVAGDCTGLNSMTQWALFLSWFRSQKYRKKVLVGGNHDGYLENAFSKNHEELFLINDGRDLNEEELERDFIYLSDSGIDFEGLKIWGSPWTKTFLGINPHCTAFTLDTESQLHDKFSLIPDNIDILITHGPPYGILDENAERKMCGSRALRECLEKAKPQLHVFGHIHEQGGKQLLLKHNGPNTICVNASIMDERYKPVYDVVRVMI